MTVQLLDPPHILDVVQGEALESALETAGAFLAKEGLGDTFAIRTLHKHFEVAANEVLRDEFNGTDLITTSVVGRNEVSEDQESQWGFFPDGTRVALSWSTDSGHTPSVREALIKIGAFLADKALTRVIAIELRGNDLKPGPGEVLLELTDAANRTQQTTVVPLTAIGSELPAGWTVSASGRVTPGTWCSTNNRSHG